VRRRSGADQMGQDYSRELTVEAPRDEVFDAIATLDGLRGWWTPSASGNERPGGKIGLGFEGVDEHIEPRVPASRRPTEVEWQILEHSALEEWTGTRVRFVLSTRGPKACSVAFQHVGLSPRLSCYDDCEAGWEHFLGSLLVLAEHGVGLHHWTSSPLLPGGGKSGGKDFAERFSLNV